MKVSRIANNRGFGLGQLLVAIVVIAVIANILEPHLSSLSGKAEAEMAKVKTEAQTILKPVFLGK